MLTQTVIFTPKSLSEALEVLNDKKPVVLAGGTDLLVQIKGGGIPPPRYIIAIDNIKALKGIKKNGRKVRIGALTTFEEILDSELLAKFAPHLLEASYEIGSPQIRARGTIGGNIMNASPAGDSIPPLFVLEAHLILQSIEGRRKVAISQFHTGPGKTIRRRDELLIGIEFEAGDKSSRYFFMRLGTRKALAIAKVSAAGMLNIKNGHIGKARIALGAVAPTVVYAHGAQDLLAGKSLSPEVALLVANAAQNDCHPIDDIRSQAEYRQAMVGVLVERGLMRIMNELNGDGQR
ncbi:MAG: hypothetical protein CO189_00845 [candidate division Zixibacteria bacterium CG_4_9_14_3_um_filter_46_8]|nr:MAG: hypothetical protein CO189_00845 [candidate division Zixibacteria bacterium CG_4_9_14_3_um_filter_46_8]